MKQYTLFPIIMKIHSVLKLPVMTGKERRLLKQILLSLWASKGESLEIFEYGSGFSTLYFARFLRQQQIPFHIDSVDNNLGWHQKVQQLLQAEKLDDTITLFLSEFPPFWEKEGWGWETSPKCGRFAPASVAELDYIKTPLKTEKKYDLVIIDGRFRRRCLEQASLVLNQNGLVFLHDAQRSHYHQPTSLYAYSRFIDSGHFYPLEQRTWEVWLGSIDNPVVFKL